VRIHQNATNKRNRATDYADFVRFCNWSHQFVRGRTDEIYAFKEETNTFVSRLDQRIRSIHSYEGYLLA